MKDGFIKALKADGATVPHYCLRCCFAPKSDVPVNDNNNNNNNINTTTTTSSNGEGNGDNENSNNDTSNVNGEEPPVLPTMFVDMAPEQLIEAGCSKILMM